MTGESNSRRTTAWVKASLSTGGSDCVEMRRDGADVQVRDSKHPDGPVLAFEPDQFAAWLHAARHGEFPT
jgi:hypothetical protein